jgi:hypothetical protein
VPKQPVFEVLRAKRFPEQRIVTKVDHPGAKIVAGSPVRVDLAEFFSGKDLLGDGLLLFSAVHRFHKDHFRC